MLTRHQTANCILMIEPVNFGYNAETASTNFFQHELNSKNQKIQQNALSEFQNMVTLLRNENIEVIVVKDTEHPITPDSIFPNNWVSFWENGLCIKYPMYAKNRRNERRDDIIEHIKSNNSKLCTLIDFSFWEEENLFLEGTGSIIFDHKQKIAYASISERTDSSLFKIFCKTFGYKAMAFHSFQTVNNKRLPIYHTNVMLSIAEEFAVICSQAIDNQTERLQVLHSLEKSGKQILEISENQMSKFAGNMLQIRNKQNQKFTVLSETAYLSLQQKQLELLISFNPMIICPIPNIEKVGGGSVRCMMAEIFK